MPLYEYKCTDCEKTVEVLQTVNALPPTPCPHCGQEDTLVKQITAPAISLQGSGWYKDGYK